MWGLNSEIRSQTQSRSYAGTQERFGAGGKVWRLCIDRLNPETCQKNSVSNMFRTLTWVIHWVVGREPLQREAQQSLEIRDGLETPIPTLPAGYWSELHARLGRESLKREMGLYGGVEWKGRKRMIVRCCAGWSFWMFVETHSRSPFTRRSETILAFPVEKL